MAGRRHPREEISAKLRQADELVNEGKTQREITRALGVSLMTYHRWRKMRETAPPLGHTLTIPAKLGSSAPTKDAPDNRLEELQIENGRLRRLVTDLLLEKMKLEDELHHQDVITRPYRTSR